MTEGAQAAPSCCLEEMFYRDYLSHGAWLGCIIRAWLGGSDRGLPEDSSLMQKNGFGMPAFTWPTCFEHLKLGFVEKRMHVNVGTVLF